MQVEVGLELVVVLEGSAGSPLLTKVNVVVGCVALPALARGLAVLGGSSSHQLWVGGAWSCPPNCL